MAWIRLLIHGRSSELRRTSAVATTTTTRAPAPASPRPIQRRQRRVRIPRPCSLQARAVERGEVVATGGTGVATVARVLERLLAELGDVALAHALGPQAVGQPDALAERAHGVGASLGVRVEDGADALELRVDGGLVELDNRRQAERVGETVVQVLFARQRVRERMAGPEAL